MELTDNQIIIGLLKENSKKLEEQERKTNAIMADIKLILENISELDSYITKIYWRI